MFFVFGVPVKKLRKKRFHKSSGRWQHYVTAVSLKILTFKFHHTMFHYTDDVVLQVLHCITSIKLCIQSSI